MGKIHKHGFDFIGTSVSNLYKFLLQREADLSGKNSYRHIDFRAAADSLLTSEEYTNLKFNKKFDKSLNKKIDYTVLKINDRAIESLKLLHSVMANNGIYCDIEFVNYHTTDINEFFNSRGIAINWLADLFGMNSITSPSELAVTASHMVAMEYIIENDLDQIIVFEDDVILDENFVKILASCVADLPKDYDFLADSTIFPDYQEFATEEADINVGSKYICRSYLQNAHTGFMLYSKQGAKKIIDAYRKHRVICSIDTFLFWLSRRGELNGYTTFYSNKLLSKKDIFGSMVTNQRT